MIFFFLKCKQTDLESIAVRSLTPTQHRDNQSYSVGSGRETPRHCAPPVWWWGTLSAQKWSDVNLTLRLLHGEIISEVKWAGRRVSHYTILRRSARTVQEMHID